MKWLALLLLCSPAWAAPSLYQWCSKGTGGVSNSSLNCGSTTGDHSFANTTVQPNHLIIVAVRTNVTVSTITDTRGLTYNPAIPPVSGTNVLSSSFFCAQTGAAAAANDTITVTLTGSTTFWGFSASECAGCSLAACGVVAANNANGTSSTWSGGTITTNNANELVIGFGAAFARNAWTGSGSFTNRTSTAGFIMGDELQATAGSVTPTATDSGSVGWAGEDAAFKTASGSYSFIQEQETTSGAGGVNSLALTVTSTGAGHFIVVFANVFTGTVQSISDNQNNNYIAFGPLVTNTHGDKLQGFYAWNTTAGVTTITMNGNNFTFGQLNAIEYSGVLATANPIDNPSPVDTYATCSSNCRFFGNSTFTSNTVTFPVSYSPTTGSMPFACGGGACIAELDAILFKPASGSTDFGFEYGDYSGASTCSAPWNQIVLDGNGSQWCSVNVTTPSVGGFSNAFVF